MSIKTTKQKNYLSKNRCICQVVVEIKDGLGDVSVCPSDVYVVIVNHDKAQEQKYADVKNNERNKK